MNIIVNQTRHHSFPTAGEVLSYWWALGSTVK